MKIEDIKVGQILEAIETIYTVDEVFCESLPWFVKGQKYIVSEIVTDKYKVFGFAIYLANPKDFLTKENYSVKLVTDEFDKLRLYKDV